MNPPRPTLSKAAAKRRASLPVRPISAPPPPKAPQPMSFRRFAIIFAVVALLGWFSGWAVSSLFQTDDTKLQALGKPLPKIKPLPVIQATHETPEIAANTPAPPPPEENTADEALADRAFGNGPYRQGELLFTAGSLDELETLLARAQTAGGNLLGVIRGSNSARLSFPDAESMDRFLQGNPGDAPVPNTELNYLVVLPSQPAVSTDPFAPGGLTAFGGGALAYMGVPQDNSNWGRGITIAMLDTGLMPATLDLLRGTHITQYDMTTGQAITAPGHGDMVAALFAGAPGEQGIAPAASLISVRVLDSNDQGDVFGVTDGIYTAVNDGAQILNLSLGTAQSSSLLQTAINYALSQGVIVVASAGNDGDNQITYPAAYPGVIAVGSIDATGQRASFSNYGSQMGLTAPGVGLNVVTVSGNMAFSGTSASAPLVTGAIAGMLSTNPGMTGPQAVTLLEQYADFAGPYLGNSNTNAFYGFGSIDLTRVLNRGNTTYSDVALADMYLNITTMPTTPTAPMQVIVQNRGNSALNSVSVNIVIGSTQTVENMSGLKPGEIRATNVELPVKDMLSAAGLPVSAEVSTPQNDVNPTNNSKARIVHLTPASSAGTGN